jgi:hypothetical protein
MLKISQAQLGICPLGGSGKRRSDIRRQRQPPKPDWPPSIDLLDCSFERSDVGVGAVGAKADTGTCTMWPASLVPPPSHVPGH